MWLRSILLLTVAGSVPAMAQQANAPAPKPSVESYLCTFAGKCDGFEAPVEARDAPATKGFRLARSRTQDEADAGPPARSQAGRSRASRAATASSSARATRGPYGARVAAAIAPARAYASGGPRADLMIGFELNSAKLTSQGLHAAQIFARSLLMPELKGKRFRIEGHTDLRGGDGINDPLSASRARAVADYLVMLGVGPDRLESRGYGADAPLQGRPSTDPANRRVEAELIS